MVKCTRAIVLTFLLIVQARAFSPDKTRFGPRSSPSSASASPALAKAAPIALSTILYRLPAYADIGGSLSSPMGDKLDGSGMTGVETAFQYFFLVSFIAKDLINTKSAQLMSAWSKQIYVFGSLAVGAKEMVKRANEQLNKGK